MKLGKIWVTQVEATEFLATKERNRFSNPPLIKIKVIRVSINHGNRITTQNFTSSCILKPSTTARTTNNSKIKTLKVMVY
jgi:hypothetical protein